MADTPYRAESTSTPSLVLFRITLGDRRRRAPGLLLVVDGGVRGLLTSGADGEVVYSLGCDRRIEPISGMMVFRDLGDALSWFEPRLGARVSSGGGVSRDWQSERSRDGSDIPSAAEAREHILICATRYCWAIDENDVPVRGSYA